MVLCNRRRVEAINSMTILIDNKSHLSQFGFRSGHSTVHTARTIMLEELRILFSWVNDEDALKSHYIKAIDIDNCLGKRSDKTRKLTARHLVELYGLDPSITLFRAFHYFWKRDEVGQPLLSLLCAYARDTLLQKTAPLILSTSEGKVITRESLEEFLEKNDPGRFSPATLKSTAQNLNSSWTKSGHLTGRAKKLRSYVHPTPGSVAYAFLLGYLCDIRGEMLFETGYTQLLDCSISRSIELAEDASRRGWMVFKRIGKVVEMLFPQILTPQEIEWSRE